MRAHRWRWLLLLAPALALTPCSGAVRGMQQFSELNEALTADGAALKTQLTQQSATPNAQFQKRVDTLDASRTQVEAPLARIASLQSTLTSHPSECTS